MSTEYYLFELGFAIVKNAGGIWYQRDRDKHEWVQDQSWMTRFYDVGYDVIQIEYDEANETIVSRERISGCWSADDWKLFEFEQN